MWVDLHSSVLDVEWGVHGPFPPEVDHQFFGFLHIQEQVGTVVPVYKKFHLLSVVFLFVHDCCVIWIFNDVVYVVFSTIVGHQVAQ